MPLWGRKKNGAESGRQHGAEARSIPGWLATDPFCGVAGLLNRWAAPVLWEALDEKVTPLLVEDAVESVKLRGAKLELKAAGQVGWLFLSALRMICRKAKLRDEVAALQERQLLMKETIESAVTRGDQTEARCTALAASKMNWLFRNAIEQPNIRTIKVTRKYIGFVLGIQLQVIGLQSALLLFSASALEKRRNERVGADILTDVRVQYILLF
ncbi:hypothetical protein NDU88_001058 [Pleurodeles waltl]|uniref:Uncharacterized protein n=1 Tax=Pleurodeles waltl TaxID=8319 RepID=A0AAV7WL82_PLEWA|nr:hypothetical protein NDU88_001058 [Pleurodeles waltl]